MFRFCKLILMSDSMKLHQKSIFLNFLWQIGIFSSISKALHRLPGFEPKPGPFPKIKPDPSKNGRARAEPKLSLGHDPLLLINHIHKLVSLSQKLQ